MSHSKEELERIVGDFNKIASRPESKKPAMNIKMMIGIFVIVVIVILVGLYLYMQKGKKIKLPGVASAAAASPSSNVSMVSPSNPTASAGSLKPFDFGSQ